MHITVSKLIELLKQYDPNKPIIIPADYGTFAFVDEDEIWEDKNGICIYPKE